MDKQRIIIGFIIVLVICVFSWAMMVWDKIEKINESMDFTINALKNIYIDQTIFYSKTPEYRTSYYESKLKDKNQIDKFNRNIQKMWEKTHVGCDKRNGIVLGCN